MNTQEKQARLVEIFNTLRANGVVKSNAEFAEIMNVNRATISSAMNGKEAYLTDKLLTRAELVLNSNGISETKASRVPVIPSSARGGSLQDFADAVCNYDCEYITAPVTGATFAITITGDSMSPEYPNGSTILIKKIDERAFIEWGKVFVLDTINGAVIKKVMPTATDDVVRCESINPAYPSFNVSTNNVMGWYRVLMVLTLK